MAGPRLSIIPARAATDPALKPRDLQVLCVLGRHTNELGWCEKSQVKMAKEMGCARSTVFEAVERLIKAGYLERHIQSQKSGRDAPHIYRVILDPVHPDLDSVKADPEPDSETDTPADQSAPPAGISAPPAGPGPAPKNDPLRTKEREGAGASEREEGQPEAAETDDRTSDDNPDSAGFQKRLARFCSGRGFVAGAWPDWDTGSLGWIGRQFAALSREERAAAERWRDPYLLDMAERKKSPMTVGVFLRDKAWEALDPMILKRAEERKAARLKPDDRAKPDGWAACRGPVGMAWVCGALLAGPADAEAARELAASGACRDQQLGQVWPKLMQWRAVLRQAGGIVFAERWHALKDAMEPVPAGTDVLAAWKAEFERRGWPWLVEFDHGDVVYCPKGGPEGLGVFEEALARIDAETEGQQEAAE